MHKKVIRTTITLIGDEFEGGANQIVAEGLRTLCIIQFGGGSVVPHAEITIYGLNMAAMLKLTRIRWQDIRSMMNVVKIEALDQDGVMVNVFEGNITFGYIDMSNAPDVAFKIRSTTAAMDIYRPAVPVTYPGEKPVVEAIEELAKGLGYMFENNGVSESITMTDATLVDTDLNKIRSLARRYQIDLYIEQNIIAIAPQGVPRNISVLTVTPQNGLIGYPAPTMQGVEFKCLYTPRIRFGGIVRLAGSLIETCNGEWRVFGVTINIESEMPGGNWFMTVQATHNEPNNAAISK